MGRSTAVSVKWLPQIANIKFRYIQYIIYCINRFRMPQCVGKRYGQFPIRNKLWALILLIVKP